MSEENQKITIKAINTKLEKKDWKMITITQYLTKLQIRYIQDIVILCNLNSFYWNYRLDPTFKNNDMKYNVSYSLNGADYKKLSEYISKSSLFYPELIQKRKINIFEKIKRFFLHWIWKLFILDIMKNKTIKTKNLKQVSNVIRLLKLKCDLSGKFESEKYSGYKMGSVGKITFVFTKY